MAESTTRAASEAVSKWKFVNVSKQDIYNSVLRRMVDRLAYNTKWFVGVNLKCNFGNNNNNIMNPSIGIWFSNPTKSVDETSVNTYIYSTPNVWIDISFGNESMSDRVSKLEDCGISEYLHFGICEKNREYDINLIRFQNCKTMERILLCTNNVIQTSISNFIIETDLLLSIVGINGWNGTYFQNKAREKLEKEQEERTLKLKRYETDTPETHSEIKKPKKPKLDRIKENILFNVQEI